MPLLLLILVFIVVPLAELYVILKVGDSIGWAPILILVVDSLLGSVLLRTQGGASGGASTTRFPRAGSPTAR